MKANELTPEYIADYLKIDDPEESDFKDIEIFHSAAIGYIKNQTGIDDQKINSSDDLTVAILVLVEDMYDNRRMYVDKQNMNRVVENIIYQYSENLI